MRCAFGAKRRRINDHGHTFVRWASKGRRMVIIGLAGVAEIVGFTSYL
jgi:hypothetical protein